MMDKKGYSIPNNEKNLKLVKKELTVKPFQLPDYSFSVKKYKIYNVEEDKIYVPKFWGIDKFGPLQFCKKEKKLDLNFSVSLREYQVEIANDLLKQVREKEGGIVQLTTGFGKTILALWLICQLKVKTLVIVHKENLKEQWQERILDFTNVTNPGTIQSKITDTDSPICVGMLQSICMRDYDPEVFQDFDMIIYDEVHHLSSEVFSKSIFKTCSKYMIGLSATPKRNDGLEKVFHWALGPIIINSSRGNNQKATHVTVQAKHEESLIWEAEKAALPPRIECPDTLRQHRQKNGNHPGLRHYNRMGKLNIAGMTTTLSKDRVRNEIVTDTIMKYYEEGREILVVSERRAHCDVLKAYLIDREVPSENIGLFLGGFKNEQLDEANKCRIIIATRKMVEEGYDNAKLNTLILVSSWSNIEQCVGRILRKVHEIEPLVVDIVDVLPGPFSAFQSQARKRKQFFKKHNAVSAKKPAPAAKKSIFQIRDD